MVFEMKLEFEMCSFARLATPAQQSFLLFEKASGSLSRFINYQSFLPLTGKRPYGTLRDLLFMI
jgi:hypothetical protein